MPRLLLAARRSLLSAACLLVALSCGDATTSNAPDVARLEASPSRLDLAIGETRGVSARALDADGGVVSRKLFWSTSNASIATVTQSGVVTSVAAGAAEVAVSSGGVSLRIPVVVAAREPSLVQLAPVTSTIMVGASTTLQATVLDASGAAVEGKAITWSTANPAIVSVGVSGVVTGIAAGSATVTATVSTSSGPINGSAVVQVLPVPVASVSVTPGSSAMLAGQSLQLIAEALDSAGGPLTGRAVAWTTNAPTVANVSSTGLVIALAPGSATITATSEGKRASASITVSSVPVSAVRIVPESATVSVNQTAQLVARVTDSTGALLVGRALSWTSDAPNVATVNGNGIVTAVATGQARVTATAEGKSGSAVVIVTPIPVASIAVTPDSGALAQGDTLQLTARLLDAQGRVLTGRVVSWISGAPSIATVDADGVVTAVGAGSALILASSEGVRATIPITVTPAAVGTVVVTPSSATVQEGATMQLAAQILDARGRPMAGKVATWSSNNTTVATVSATGLVQAIATGKATISARSDGVTGTSTITVVLVPVANVALSPPTANVFTGRTVQLTATLTDANGKSLPLNGRSVTWSSNAPSIATVGATGVVTGTSAGIATVTAQVDGAKGIASVVVSDAPVSSVQVSPGSQQLSVGGTAQLSATALDASGGVLTGRPVTWSSSDAAVASVSSSGLVSALAPGTAQLTATIGGVSGSATVTVAAVAVASVAVTPGSASVVTGGTVQLTASAKDAAGNVLTGRAVTWTSGTPAVATIDANGLVTAVSPGTSVMTASIGGVTATATITVTAVAVASVTVTPNGGSVTAGATMQLTATPRDAGGNVLTGRTTAWKSATTAVATVNANGVVSGVSAGTSVITATIDGISANVTVTVSNAPVISASVSPASSSVVVGGTVQLAVTARDGSGAIVTGRPTVWTTGNPSVATVDANGLATGVAAGSTSLTVSVEGVRATANVTVTEIPIASITLNPTTASVTAGATVTLAATPLDAKGNALAGRTLTWSSSNSAVATVSQSGVVSGVTAGSATITVSGASAGQSPPVTKSATLTVTAPTVQGPQRIVISPLSGTLHVGAAYARRVSAQVFDAAGAPMPNEAVTWTTSDPRLVVVPGSPSTGATIGATGTPTGGLLLIASAGSTSPVADTIAITSDLVPVARVIATPLILTILHKATQQLTATAFDSASNIIGTTSGNPLGGRVPVWTSFDTKLVTIDSAGVATGGPQSGITRIEAYIDKVGPGTILVIRP